MLGLTRLPQPVIARVHGIATAAGCQLVAACDLAVCSDDSRFATSGVKYGLFCSTPMVALSRNVPRKPAMEMLLTGDFIDAAEALRLGLVNQVVPTAGLDAAVDGLARASSTSRPAVLALGKRAFYRQLEMGLEEAYALTTEVIVENALGRTSRKASTPSSASAAQSGPSPDLPRAPVTRYGRACAAVAQW